MSTFCVNRPKPYEEPCSAGGGEGLDRERERERDRQRVFEELLKRRQAAMFSGQHPGLEEMFSGRQSGIGGMGGHCSGMGGMGGHSPIFMGGHGMHPMMGGGYPTQGSRSPMGMGPGVGGMGMGMGTHPAMGRMGGMGGMGSMRGMGHMGHMGMGHQSYFSHSPFGSQRHPPFGYGGPGPPRYPQYRHPQSRHSPFPPSGMFDDYSHHDYHRMPSGHGHGGHMRGGFRPRHPGRRRGFRPGMFDDSDDDFDEYGGYDDDFEDEDGYGGYGARRSSQMRWQGGGYY